MMKRKIILYLPNKPDVDLYKSKRQLKNLGVGEIQEIITATGNHWRKIFSIYAKISFGLTSFPVKTWQEYRDTVLLTKSGIELITFSRKILSKTDGDIHVLSGKNHCLQFDLPLEKFKNLDVDGKILKYKNIYLTPYFDYRQLPNALVELIVKDIASNF
jgi:hypothetical protein